MEASTSEASLYGQLTGQGFDFAVSHPKKTRYIAEAIIESDRVDSKVIAEWARLVTLTVFRFGKSFVVCKNLERKEWIPGSASI
jgi:hypothetical protein